MNIEDFCATNDCRSYLNKPFSIDNHVVGSNGHWMAFAPISEKREQEKLIDERVSKIISGLISKSTTLKYECLPEFSIPTPLDCPRCTGSKKSESTICQECGGDGAVDVENYFSTYHDLECKTCSGLGFNISLNTNKTCESCNGTGEAYAREDTIVIGGVPLNPNYLIKIADIPNIQVSADTKNRLLFFKAAGISGVLMGLAL